jgi:hypothetical protein
LGTGLGALLGVERPRPDFSCRARFRSISNDFSDVQGFRDFQRVALAWTVKPLRDSEQLALLQRIREMYLESAEHGDEDALRIVTAVEEMIQEAEIWVRK